MNKIKLYNKISENGLSIFDKDKYEIAEEMQNEDAVLVRSAKMHDVEFPKSLRCIARAGAGTNNIPLDRCAKEGIVVFNTPGANANAVKELVIASLLLSSRKILHGIDWCRTLTDKGADVEALVEAGKSQFIGPEIKGKKLGVLGLGAIGVMVSNAAKSLGMEVYGCDPYMSIKSALSLSRGVNNVATMKEIFAKCDYITLHMPLTEETRGVINKETIAMMKDNIRILNFSRGELVNDDDMLEAIESGKVARYVTDFPNAKLLTEPKITLVPHLGASTPESEENCAKMAVEQVIEFLENGNIVNSVNYPNVELPRDTDFRICITHLNSKGIVGQFAQDLGANDINIENMANRSKGEYAYTILDVNTDVSDKVVKEIEAMEGVISVRVIR